LELEKHILTQNLQHIYAPHVMCDSCHPLIVDDGFFSIFHHHHATTGLPA
jgi:hypothetical protein